VDGFIKSGFYFLLNRPHKIMLKKEEFIMSGFDQSGPIRAGPMTGVVQEAFATRQMTDTTPSLEEVVGEA